MSHPGCGAGSVSAVRVVLLFAETGMKRIHYRVPSSLYHPGCLYTKTLCYDLKPGDVDSTAALINVYPTVRCLLPSELRNCSFLSVTFCLEAQIHLGSLLYFGFDLINNNHKISEFLPPTI